MTEINNKKSINLKKTKIMKNKTNFKFNLYILQFTIIGLFVNNSAFSQAVGISGDVFVPDSSAILEIQSTQKGLLFPRMTTAQRDSISDGDYGYNAELSLFIYNTTTDCYEFYAYGDWHEIACYVDACGNEISFIDSRDSKEYNIVAIGNQCWMEENLNYGTYVTIATGQGGAGTQKYCYSDNTANCTTYGGLYEWTEVMNGSSSCNGTGESQPVCSLPAQGICPSGWHLPSHYEWTALERAVCTSGSCVADFPYDSTTTGWIGTIEGSKLAGNESLWTNGILDGNGTPLAYFNEYEFTALPGGYSWSGSFSNVANYGDWWSSTEYDSTRAWRRYLGFSMANVYRHRSDKVFGFSVRCLKD
jgi:uncharacterized protein (TIGR02145 family)